MTETTDFFAFLPSNDPSFPDNKISNFRTELAIPLILHGEWEVALSHISFTKSWKTFQDSKCFIRKFFNYSDGTEIEVTIPGKTCSKEQELVDYVNNTIKTKFYSIEPYNSEMPIITYDPNTRKFSMTTGYGAKSNLYVLQFDEVLNNLFNFPTYQANYNIAEDITKLGAPILPPTETEKNTPLVPSKIPQVTVSKVPQVPEHPVLQGPGIPVPTVPLEPVPRKPTPQITNTPTPQEPKTSAPQGPKTPTPQVPTTPTPQEPKTSDAQEPKTPTPQISTTPTPQVTETPVVKTPEILTPVNEIKPKLPDFLSDQEKAIHFVDGKLTNEKISAISNSYKSLRKYDDGMLLDSASITTFNYENKKLSKEQYEEVMKFLTNFSNNNFVKDPVKDYFLKTLRKVRYPVDVGASDEFYFVGFQLFEKFKKGLKTEELFKTDLK